MPVNDYASGNETLVKNYDPSVAKVLETIKAHFPDTPYLALGQTVFWDEPTKAVWRRLLDILSPGSEIIAGVHDTDYFAKFTSEIHTDRNNDTTDSKRRSNSNFAIVTHDDAMTRGLWSAAGELSSLFGSETVPTRQMFIDNGVPFDALTKGSPVEKAKKYSELTTAWGWTGIVRTDAHNIVACEIPVVDFADTLLEQLDWGFNESISCLADTESKERGKRVAEEIKSWINDFLLDCSEYCKLADLYQTLLPKFYRLLLNETPQNLCTTCSRELFQFNPDTCHLPRFKPVGWFLNPETSAIARDAYNQAVSRSGIYPLDIFGPGAIPFDLVLPGTGRGTLFVRDDGVTFQVSPTKIMIISGTPVKSVEELADAVEKAFGHRASLVGKAITLVDMIAAEHLVIFHETASGYTPITRTFNKNLKNAGIEIDLKPIVRLAYPTWDTFGMIESNPTIQLPEHLSQAFRKPRVTVKEFSSEWRSVIDDQHNQLNELKHLHKVKDLMKFYNQREQSNWSDKIKTFENAISYLKSNFKHSLTLSDRIDEHYDELKSFQNQRKDLEHRKGEDWRKSVLPLIYQLEAAENSDKRNSLQAQIERHMAIRATAFDEPIAELRDRIATTKRMISSFRRERKRIERNPEAIAARRTIEQITHEVQTTKLYQVRNAYLTIEGLHHTHLRPTSWWIPMVDSSGKWFEAMVKGTKASFEYLV